MKTLLKTLSFTAFLSAAALTVLLAMSCDEQKPAPGGGDKPEPETPEFSIGGVDVADYRIVYDSDDGESIVRRAALELRTAFKSAGYELQVYSKDSDKKGNEILVGDCSRTDGYASGMTDPFAWKITLNEGRLQLEGGSSWGVLAAAKELAGKYISEKKSMDKGFAMEGSCRSTAIFDRPAGTNLRIFDWNIWNYSKTTIPAGFYEDGKLLYDPRNENRGRDVAAVLRCVEPDIIGLQEYKSMADCLEPLIISKYKKCVSSSSQWCWTPLFYNSATVTPKSVEYRLYDSPWSDSNSKSYMLAIFEHKATGREFIVVATHLWWKSESAAAGSDNARLAQAGLIIDRVNEILKENSVPVFVMGDMNCKYPNAPIQAFVTDGWKTASKDAVDYRDGSQGYHSCSPDGFKPETAAQKADSKGETAIDHMMFKNCDGKASVKEYHIIHTSFTYPMSDHAPRYIDVTIK